MYFAELSRTYTQWWQVKLVRGLITGIIGLLVFTFPAQATAALLTVFALYLMVDGGLVISAAWLSKTTLRLWPMVLARGLVVIGAGVFALSYREITLALFEAAVALLIIFRGVLEFIAFVEIEDATVQHRRVLLLSAVVTVLAGGWVLIDPFGGAYAFERFVGIYALVEGALHAAAAWRLRDRFLRRRARHERGLA